MHLDLDEMIESKMGTSVRSLFQSLGEKEFRNLERELFFELLKQDVALISVGGGAQIPKSDGSYVNIWIKTDLDLVASRLDPDAPYLKNQKFQDWVDTRFSLYSGVADYVLELTGIDLKGDTHRLWEIIHSVKSSI
ncbi:MAG: shikimate kinase [Chlamydiia bacterium]